MKYNEKIQLVLNKEGKNKPTLIQERTYDAIKNGASVIGLAKTGTGKTLAYALPTLEKVKQGEKHSLIILAPTTELAVQIRNVVRPYAQSLGLKVMALVGAGNRKRQNDQLKKENYEVLVCTPGRFFDFFSSGRIKLNQIKTLVIDEADDILEFTKLDLLSSLGQNLLPDSQILLFGATESRIIREAEEIFARNFLLIDVRPDQDNETEHDFLQVDNEHKMEFLQRLTKLDKFRGLVFFDSNDTMLRFARIFAHTKTKFDVLANDFSKDKRQKALRNLSSGKTKLLLATDLAARGLDIPKLTYVINYEIPSEFNTYMHRAGRTGRMQQKGYVVTLGDDHDYRDLKKLLAGEVSLQRVYFAGYKLTTEKPKAKSTVKEKKQEEKVPQVKPLLKKSKKRKKRPNKNKGYHPHYLKNKGAQSE